jgi:hypothetical protein
MGRPKTHGVRLYPGDICALLGIKLSTWKIYVSNGTAPYPDGGKGTVMGPWWYEVTIKNWIHERQNKKRAKRGSELANRHAYDEAARLIEIGAWVVNPEHGYVYGGTLGTSSGTITMNFRCACGEMHSVLVHRVIWEWRTGKYEPLQGREAIRHRDGIKCHNCIHNLECIHQSDARQSYGVFEDDSRS